VDLPAFTETVSILQAWAEKQAVPGLKATIYDQLKNDITNATAPPLLIVDIPGIDMSSTTFIAQLVASL
jgi:hypothetical protein